MRAKNDSTFRKNGGIENSSSEPDGDCSHAGRLAKTLFATSKKHAARAREYSPCAIELVAASIAFLRAAMQTIRADKNFLRAGWKLPWARKMGFVRNNFPFVRELEKFVRTKIALGGQEFIPTAIAKLRAEENFVRAPLAMLRARQNRSVRRRISFVRVKILSVRPCEKFGGTKISLGAPDFIPASI